MESLERLNQNESNIDWVEISSASKHLQRVNGEAIQKLQKKVITPQQLHLAKAIQSVLAFVEIIQNDVVSNGTVPHSYVNPEEGMELITAPLSLKLKQKKGFLEIAKPVTDSYGINKYGVDAYWVPSSLLNDQVSLQEWQDNLAIKAQDIASEVFVTHNKFIPFTECQALRVLIGGRWSSDPLVSKCVIEAYNSMLTKLLLANGV